MVSSSGMSDRFCTTGHITRPFTHLLLKSRAQYIPVAGFSVTGHIKRPLVRYRRRVGLSIPVAGV